MKPQSFNQQQALADQLLDYQTLSTHRFEGYAPGPEALDWDDQPSPFRHYEGAPKLDLPLEPDCAEMTELPAHLLFRCADKTQPLNLDTLSFFLRQMAGLTAWKVFGPDRWSLRATPSSGNLHPGEVYLLLPAGEQWQAGVYHYDPLQHQLELRRGLVAGTVSSPMLILTSVLDREAWKYGERALRYCYLDAGHQLAQAKASANLLGWQIHSLLRQDGPTLEALCGLRRGEFDRVESEYPLHVASINASAELNLDKAQIDQWPSAWHGRPSALGGHSPYQWKICHSLAEQLSEASLQPLYDTTATKSLLALDSDLKAVQVIQRRRSAQAYDSQWQMPKAQFIQLLTGLQPGYSDLLASQPRVHLLCFVHAVEGLEPGLFLLARSDKGQETLAQTITAWQPWAELQLSDELSLQQMKVANTRKAAGQLGCHQSIAASSAVTLVMLADFNPLIADQRVETYPALYEEAGMLGQQLYLSATALGFSGTGIGCFFDESIRGLLGLESEQFKPVYGFALGAAIVDGRMTGLSGYHHLKSNQYSS